MIGSDMRARIVPYEVQSISDRVGVCKKRKCKRQATQDTKPDVCQTTGRMATLIYCCVAQSGKFESIYNSSRMSMRRIIRWNYFGARCANHVSDTPYTLPLDAREDSLCRFTRTTVNTGFSSNVHRYSRSRRHLISCYSVTTIVNVTQVLHR